jgi:TatD DNase family protein
MKLFDTHAHLQFEKFEKDRKDVVSRSSRELFAVLNPGADISSSKMGVALAQKVGNFYSAVGVHPHHVENWTSEYVPSLRTLVTEEKVVAVGEIGLDNHSYQGYPQPDLKKQVNILLPQIELAREFKKPILFHCREAYNELYETIKQFKPLTGLVHCFMGDKKIAKKFVDLGLLISFAGNLTYKGNDHMQEAAKYLSEDQILLETDSPYLAPEPLRGQRNEPINVKLVAKFAAFLRGTSEDRLAVIETKNARKVFSV